MGRKNRMIVAAAIRVEDSVFTGRRHCEIFQSQPFGMLRHGVQGFVTDDGQFVDREEALKIAVANNQIIVKHGQSDELYSEDIFE